MTPEEIQLTEALIRQLSEAIKTATETGDPTVKYMVERALAACLVRWGPKPETGKAPGKD